MPGSRDSAGLPEPAADEAAVVERIGFLEQANAALEDFVRTAASELRTPLGHVRGFAELLAESASGLDADGQRHVETILRAADRMDRLTGDLLALSEVESLPLIPGAVDLGALVAELLDERRNDALVQRAEWTIGPLPVVRGDRVLLRIALGRLFDNAVKFSAPRDVPTIALSAGRDEAAGEVLLRLRDNGVGFDPRYSQRLFQPLQRMHPASRFAGSGVGLALVRRIVLRHGGRVGAESAPEQGATFWIALPG